MTAALLFIPLFAFAHVIQDDVSTTDKSDFSFQTVCSRMVTHESPLIEALSGTELDCMGKKVQVADFCDKEMAQDPYYIRAYVDKERKKVVCHSGKKVLFKYLCVKLTDRKLCSGDARMSCEVLRGKLARRLDIVHASQVKNEKGVAQLNCFYESAPALEGLNGSL